MAVVVKANEYRVLVHTNSNVVFIGLNAGIKTIYFIVFYIGRDYLSCCIKNIYFRPIHTRTFPKTGIPIIFTKAAIKQTFSVHSWGSDEFQQRFKLF